MVKKNPSQQHPSLRKLRFGKPFRPLLAPLCLAIAGYLVISARSNANPLASQAIFHQQSWVPTLAQGALPLPLTQQGNQIVLNGRSLPGNWSQRQQTIGISDISLLQTLGVDLLNTSNATRQPVQWFSDPASLPLVLPTWLTAQYRYLDITELARQANWQVRANGGTLQIATPPTQVVGIRQGRQSWGDRIVVDLDQPTPWQVTQEASELVITLDAQASPALLQSFIPTAGNRLTSLNIQASGNQTLVRIGIPAGLRPQVWTLPNPNRLIIDIRDAVRERDILWANGVRWREQIVTIRTAQFPVISLLIDPQQQGLAIKPVWTNPAGAVGTAPLIRIAQQSQVAAAINGGFFNRNNQLPLGALRRDNRWISGPILNRGAIAWSDTGTVAIDRLDFRETLSTSTGQQYPISLFNTGYVRAGIARYTTDWGTSYTNIIDNETILTVQNNQVVRQQTSTTQGQTTVPIPTNGYLLVVRSFNTALAALPVGTTLQLSTVLSPAAFNQYPQIVGAGPLLIRDRQIVLNPQAEQFTDAFIQQAAVRSVIAKMPEGKLMLLAIQNRVNGSGPTLSETAEIVSRMGAIDALNLDGGSSTSLYLGGTLINRSPRTVARVHNGIGIFIQPNF
ncbi:phosphodiester glycosidase family protein [Oscillatoria sp. FACHB-1407]|uniref:phosphodiester glycosidase family protein n=1 Tax=Oscillatoria sp. FACHB-1407 TaxID=2692847 RepID=UPI0016846848|nr:phosphodiester glycosidase family protein [Oscillatoria sp. FACHB-1407]MBD2465323.1 phosphodiester glycosidase family protein [Oscillatoria sp. FACHB-1407]